jgi:hypothetical protein
MGKEAGLAQAFLVPPTRGSGWARDLPALGGGLGASLLARGWTEPSVLTPWPGGPVLQTLVAKLQAIRQ